MQILRTIALKCMCTLIISTLLLADFASFSDGAALFYTTPLPATLQVLRQYTLHSLFIPPAPPPAGLSTEAPAPVKNVFPFTNKPNTLDRDHIVVPAGWDSWGKIAVLRDGFDAKGWGEAWESDMEQDVNAVEDETGAKRMFAALVPDQGARVGTTNRIIVVSLRTDVRFSRHPCHPSAIQHQSKPSSRKTTTKIRRNPIRTPAMRSKIQPRVQQQASLARSRAAVSTFPVLIAPSLRWRLASLQ